MQFNQKYVSEKHEFIDVFLFYMRAICADLEGEYLTMKGKYLCFPIPHLQLV